MYTTGTVTPISTIPLVCDDCAKQHGIPIFTNYYVEAACTRCATIKPVAAVDADTYLLSRMRTLLGTADLSTDYLEKIVREADLQGLSQDVELTEFLGDVRRTLRRRSR